MIDLPFISGPGHGAANKAALQTIDTGEVYQIPHGGYYEVDPGTFLAGKKGFKLLGTGAETIVRVVGEGVILKLESCSSYRVADMTLEADHTQVSDVWTVGIQTTGQWSGTGTFADLWLRNFPGCGVRSDHDDASPASGMTYSRLIHLGCGRADSQQMQHYARNVNDSKWESCDFGVFQDGFVPFRGAFLDRCQEGEYLFGRHWGHQTGALFRAANGMRNHGNRFETNSGRGFEVIDTWDATFTGFRCHTNSMAGQGQSNHIDVWNSSRCIFDDFNLGTWGVKVAKGMSFDATCRDNIIGARVIKGYTQQALSYPSGQGFKVSTEAIETP